MDFKHRVSETRGSVRRDPDRAEQIEEGGLQFLLPDFDLTTILTETPVVAVLLVLTRGETAREILPTVTAPMPR